ncbi:MAG: TIGR00159 family protein [Candidatus Cloacimonas sp. 4484_143]|nr:MAG: TIGR00159 family protein [Candidatus Cloacimonas sp. 4484_143]RLC51495.1 MAG: TIGR00159 family protein [Candidatus Cloacimonadota bacterium]RLC53565.1 MAG: TIGR00159 family protein [Candidatus Cloacimonadota bacterium]
MEILIPKFTDILDIIIIAFIIYKFIMLLKRVGGIQIIVGLLAAVLIYFTASVMNLNMVSSLLGILKDYWIIVFIILFQQEIRSIFARIGRSHDLRSLFKSPAKSVYPPLLNAVSIMSFRKLGALIIIENNRKLDEFIESGEMIDARISVKLLLTIFNNKTILHDGAAIIRNDRILAVKVVLPLSENVEYAQKLGTRHLAAVGITENTDSFAIVVSEETGKISVARNGELTTDLTIDELSQRIKDETS